MRTHTLSAKPGRRLAAGLLALVLAAGMALPPAFATDVSSAAPSAVSPTPGETGTVESTPDPSGAAPDPAADSSASGDPEYTPPPPQDTDLSGADPQQDGFVLDEAENGGLPTLFADAATAADDMTWQDYGYAAISANPDLLPLGSGTADDPYIVLMAEQMGWIAYQANVKGQKGISFSLMSDIDLGGRQWVPLRGESIAAYTKAYTGTINGNGYYIDNLTCSQVTIPNATWDNRVGSTLQGLVGQAYGATIRNLFMRNVSIHLPLPSGSNAGVYGISAGLIGEVTGPAISNPQGVTTIEGCGILSGQIISNANWYLYCVGGLVGDYWGGTLVMKNCFSRISLVNDVNPANCGDDYCVGGLVGRVLARAGNLTNCYISSPITGTYAAKSNSFLTLSKNLSPDTLALTNCYYESGLGGIVQSGTFSGLTGLAKASMQNNSSFLTKINNNQNPQIWFEDIRKINDGYPLSTYQQDPSWQEVGMLTKDVPAKGADGFYQIGTAEQLAWFAAQVNGNSTQFRTAKARLTADIDLTGSAYGGTAAAPYLWKPLGLGRGLRAQDGCAPYCGEFDGAGHVIRNIRVAFSGKLSSTSTSSELGFFGTLGAGASVHDLFLDGVTIRHSATNLSSVTAGAFAGLVIGASIQNCAVLSGSVEVEKAQFAGGFIGEAWGSEWWKNSVIPLSAPTVLKNLSCRVAFTAKNSSSTFGSAGGFLGRLWSAVAFQQENCYSLNETMTISGVSRQGGFLGTWDDKGTGPVTNCFYANSLSASAAGAKITAAELKAGADLLNQGALPRQWHWGEPYGYDNGGYPLPLAPKYADWYALGERVAKGTLAGYAAPAGSGTKAAPYKIENAEQLAWFAYKFNTATGSFRTAYLTLEADIDLTGARYGGSEKSPLNWVPIGWSYVVSTGFGGLLEGAGHTITGLCASSQRLAGNTVDVGLFGHISGGTVQNLLLKNPHNLVNSPSTGSWVGLGGLVSRLTSGAKLVNCGVQGGLIEILPSSSAWSENFVGGLVGDLHFYGATLQNCFSTAEVVDHANSKKHTTGGLLGRIISVSTVKNCYAAGKVTGGSAFCALISANCKTAYNYADTQAAGAGVGAGATALTTEQMKSLATLENLNKDLVDSAGNPYEAFVYDATNENSGYPLLVFDRTAAGEAFFTTNGSTITVAPSLAAGEVLIPVNVTGTASASVKADSTFTTVFELSSYMPGVVAGKDSADTATHPYPALQSAVLDLGAGGLPKGAAIVLAYRTGAKTGDTYDRAYAKYVAGAAVANGQVSLTDFTLMTGGSLALADLLQVAKQQLVVYVDYTGVALADNAAHTGSVRLVCTGAAGTEVLAGSHDLSTPSTMPTLAASDPAAPAAYALALASAATGENVPFQPGDLKLTVTYSGGSQSADNAKGVALGAVVCLKDTDGKSQPLTNVVFSADGGATWTAPSNAYYMLVPASGADFYARGFTDKQKEQLTAQLYASATQIDKALPRGAYLVAQASDQGSTETAVSYALQAEAKADDDRVYEVNTAGNSLTVLLSAQPDPLPNGCSLGVQLLKKQADGSYAQAGGLLTVSGSLATGENTLQLAGSAPAGTYRLLFTLYDVKGTAMASAPFNILLRQES